MRLNLIFQARMAKMVKLDQLVLWVPWAPRVDLVFQAPVEMPEPLV